MVAMNTEQKKAQILHDKFCRWNHTDQCSWYSEEAWETQEKIQSAWEQNTHLIWLGNLRILEAEFAAVSIDLTGISE